MVTNNRMQESKKILERAKAKSVGLLDVSTKSDLLQASKAIITKVKQLIGNSETEQSLKLGKLLEQQVHKILGDEIGKVEVKLSQRVDSLQKAYESSVKQIELLIKNLPQTILPKEAIQVSVAYPTRVVKSIVNDPITGRPAQIIESIGE